MLKNILIIVNDIEKSIAFYKEIFGLEVICNAEGNVVLTEGLVLQDVATWKATIEKEIISKNNASLLYFEEQDMDAFVEKLENYKEPISYMNHLIEFPWGQKMIRFYDLDGNLIEVRTPA